MAASSDSSDDDNEEDEFEAMAVRVAIDGQQLINDNNNHRNSHRRGKKNGLLHDRNHNDHDYTRHKRESGVSNKAMRILEELLDKEISVEPEEKNNGGDSVKGKRKEKKDDANNSAKSSGLRIFSDVKSSLAKVDALNDPKGFWGSVSRSCQHENERKNDIHVSKEGRKNDLKVKKKDWLIRDSQTRHYVQRHRNRRCDVDYDNASDSDIEVLQCTIS